ncbi:hypothetical protein D9758_006762 [Tetrapyrgos nigripes]|uniref:Rpr2-domain-containing protein n=1 Tax=Tetrapyrgos nigripes TaxID=182062 RepID=A0A8H5CW45_9AGAR|nr:hypothetical protein D9758_006762 [Tetrapyrgos nigripes]
MAKTPKNETPGPNSVPNRDIMQRLNFLYQASVYLNSVDTSSPQPTDTEQSWSRRKPNARVGDISRNYIDMMKVVGTKTTVKMDPSVKRTLCKGCSSVLVPGTTATIRTKKSSSHGHAVTYTCMICNESRRLPAPPLSDAEETMPEATMDVDSSAGPQKKSRRKKRANRQVALFARTRMHVVHRGNERVDEDSLRGNGLFMV